MTPSNPAPTSNRLVDQAACGADQAIQATQRAADGAFQSLSNGVKGIHDATAPLLNNAVDQATAMAHSSLDAVRDSSRRLRDQARQATDQTVGYIKDEPIKSMLMAAATGAMLMGLINLMSRSRDRN